MTKRALIAGIAFALITATAHGATGRLTVPGVRAALVRDGFPARAQCGEVMEPPPALDSHTHIFHTRMVPACWVVVEHDSYSVQVTPHTSDAAAKLAYTRTRNPATKRSRGVVIGKVVVSGFRVGSRDWLQITRVVASVVG